MRENWKLVTLAAFIFVFATGMFVWHQQSQEALAEHDGIIRLHVIANSNTKEDQELKLLVRDRILNVVNSELVDMTMDKYTDVQSRDAQIAKLSSEELRQYIAVNSQRLEAAAEGTLREHGCEDQVQVKLGTRWIPERVYGDIKFPAGNYEALDVRIGNARGHNWWCVLYPPLCLIDSASAPPDNVNEITPADRLILKSKTLELLDKSQICHLNVNNCSHKQHK